MQNLLQLKCDAYKFVYAIQMDPHDPSESIEQSQWKIANQEALIHFRFRRRNQIIIIILITTTDQTNAISYPPAFPFHSNESALDRV